MTFDTFFDDNTAAKGTAAAKETPKKQASVTGEMEDFFGQPAPESVSKPAPTTDTTQQANENPVEAASEDAGNGSEPEFEPESQDGPDPTMTTTVTTSESGQEPIVSVSIGPQVDERECQFIELGNRVSILKIRINDLSARQAAMKMELESILDQQNSILKDLAEDVKLDPISSTPAVASNVAGVAVSDSVPVSKPSQVEATEPASKPSSVSSLLVPVANGEWRNNPIGVLPLDTINRFGKKKIEALHEAAPTIGSLYDMIHNGGINVKGVGDDSKDAIGTMLAEWLEANVAATAS